jgi:hypothetical protein
MASTINPTAFTITIQEEQIVKGVKQINTTKYSIPSVTNTDNRVVTCPNTTSVSLFTVNTASANPGAGLFPSSSLKYARISNLDDKYPVYLTVSGSKGTFTQIVNANSTIMLSNVQITASNSYAFSSSNYSALNDNINTVFAYASGSDITIEYMLINA